MRRASAGVAGGADLGKSAIGEPAATGRLIATKTGFHHAQSIIPRPNPEACFNLSETGGLRDRFSHGLLGREKSVTPD
jgi:hypothetical protein